VVGAPAGPRGWLNSSYKKPSIQYTGLPVQLLASQFLDLLMLPAEQIKPTNSSPSLLLDRRALINPKLRVACAIYVGFSSILPIESREKYFFLLTVDPD
jgi:hypothetical protein